MRKKMLLLTALVGITTAANATGRGGSDGPYFYLKADIGYNFKAAPIVGRTMNSSSNNSNTSRHYEINTLSFGTGFMPKISAGVMFNSSIGTELHFAYLIGSAQTYNISSSSSSNTFNGSTTSSSSSDELTFSPSMYMLAPMLVLQTKLGGNILPYAKIGPVFGLAPSISLKENMTNTSSPGNNSVSYQETKLDGGWAWGFGAVVGTEITLNEIISIFGELSLTSMSYAPSKGTIVSSTTNGKDNMTNATTAQKETDYLDSYDTNSGTPSDPTQPSKNTKFYYPFSSIGLQAGIKISFGK